MLKLAKNIQILNYQNKITANNYMLHNGCHGNAGKVIKANKSCI
jgi:hypothetical protein